MRADDRNPITRGYVCNKGFSIPLYVDPAQRLEHPLRRRPDGGFERVDWDTAILEIAERLSAVRDASPRGVALIGVGGQANHTDGPFALSFLHGLGSKRWFDSFAQEKTQHFLIDHWLFDSAPSVWFQPDVEHTSHLLVLGSNPRISNTSSRSSPT